MPGKMARSDPRPSVRVTRSAGSGQHLASVLQEGRENANIDAALGIHLENLGLFSPGRNQRRLIEDAELGFATMVLALFEQWYWYFWSNNQQ